MKKILALILLAAVLCTASCRSVNPPQPDPALDEPITTHLVEQIGISGFEGEIFCAFEYLDLPREVDQEIYIWALCQEYYLEGSSLTEGSGISLPVALQVEELEGQPQITGHLIPGDGSRYGPDVKEIFPASIWGKILPDNDQERNQYNLRASQLLNEVRGLAGEGYSTEE